jgi:hypothetical protein
MLFSMVQSRGGTLRKCDWGSRNSIARALSSSKNVISRPRKKNSTMTSAQFHGRIFTNHWNQHFVTAAALPYTPILDIRQRGTELCSSVVGRAAAQIRRLNKNYHKHHKPMMDWLKSGLFVWQ